MTTFNAKESRFIEEIEDLVWEKDISYLDAVIEWCSNNGVEFEQVTSLIKKDPELSQRLKDEAIKLHFLKKD